MKFTGERFIPTVVDTDDEIKIEHMQRYYAIQDIVKGKVVLDAACGEGYGTNMLSEYALKVYGLDIDEETIEHAKEKYTKANIEYQQGSIEELPFPNDYFDVVASFETIEHVNEEIQAKFLKEIKRVLKADGTLIMSTPNKKIYSDYRNYKNPFHVKEFYEDEYYTFLKSAFKKVVFNYQYRESVFLLTGKDSEHIETLKLNKMTSENSKYIVAICSDKMESNYHVSSAYVENGTFNRNLERIITLQNDVVDRNNHIVKLDNEIEEKNNYINNMQDDLTEKNNYLKQLDKELKNRNQQFYELSKTLEENNLILEKKQNEYETIRVNLENLINENEILKDKGNQLNNIFESDGWKMLLRYYRIRDKIFNPNGKMRFFAKMGKRIIIDRNFKMINKENIKKFRYYYKNQGLSMLENRVDNYIERNTNTNKPMNLEIEVVTNYEKLVFKKYEKPTVSVVIPVYNQWHYTYACLKSILTHTKNVTYEIILADDMSTDETVNVGEYAENIKVVRDGENRGFLLNCNNAAKHAEGDYILFLNNDTQVQEGWLGFLVELIESDKKIGMVGSKLVYPDGRLQEAGGIIWNDASGWNFGRLDDPAKPEYNYVKEVDYISGAAIMIKQNLWIEIGGFDERYVPAYFEDSDLAFEVRKHGYKVMFQPNSVVVHFEGISHGVDVSEGVKRYQELNKSKFIEKWAATLQSEQFQNGENVFKARDRSSKKKTIVVIDHYVPHFDKDAGSRTTYHYLKLFTTMGLNVKFIGDNYYKHEPYTEALEKIGVEVLYHPYNLKNIEIWLKQNGDHIDYVYLNRPHISIKYIDLVKKFTDAKIIYYGHDLHFLREYREFELTGNKALIESSEEWKKTEFDLYEKSNVVYYPSDIEIQEIKKYYPNLNAKAIPAYIFDEKLINTEIDFNKKEGLLFVGGFGHKPNIDAVLWFTNKVLPNVLKENPEIKFYIVGSNPPDEIKLLASNNIIVTGFITDKELEDLYEQCKIVVVPLRYGAGVKGKVIEAMYYQLPIVTTSVGAEGIEGSEHILCVVDEEEQFATNIVQLYENTKVLDNMGQQSLKYVNEHFTAKSVEKIISQDIKK